MAAFLFMTLLSLGVGIASGAVINFDSVVNGTQNQQYGPSLTTQGYTFTSEHFHINDAPGSCSFGGCTTLNGTQYVNVDGPQLGTAVVMTREGGGTFDVLSLQASKLFVDGTAAALANFVNADSILLIGALSGGGTVSVSVPLPALPSYNSFTLPGTFVSLVSLTISGSVAGLTEDASWAIDNITVNDVPEPASVLLTAAGLAALLGLRKNHQ
jgi:hypothetical protein